MARSVETVPCKICGRDILELNQMFIQVELGYLCPECFYKADVSKKKGDVVEFMRVRLLRGGKPPFMRVNYFERIGVGDGSEGDRKEREE